MTKDKRWGQGGSDNPGLELDDVTFQTDSPAVCPQTFQPPRKVSSASGTSRTVRAVVRWASYTCSRWKHSARQRIRRKLTGEMLTLKYKGLAEDKHEEEEGDVTDGAARLLNKKLLDHFRELAASNQEADQVDLQYLDTLIADGADPNSTDRYGQTVLHEISRAWNVDVMWFFLERGADLHRPDGFGVTALHVAAALDYQEMISFLLDHKVAVECRTVKVQQTPLHFAAKNDAVEAIRLLVQAGADINSRDYKSRTPLQLAANLDRSEAARTLLDLGAEAGVKDIDGQLCITAMIDRMTPVAHLALKQFHVQDRMTRQQYYHLHLLEPDTVEPREKVVSEPTTPLECIVHQGRLELIMHPVVLKLIDIKWKLYGRLGAWLFLVLNFLFIVAWTALAIAVSARQHTPEIFPLDWWCVSLLCVAVLLTVEEVFREISDMCRSRFKRKLWKDWSSRRLTDDLANTHPMWPEERHFLENQIKEVKMKKGNYIQDLWNLFDWSVYGLLAVVFGILVAAMFLRSPRLHTVSLRVFAVVIIFLWLRLMKHVRAFRVMGPFIVMLGMVIGDVMRFFFLYAEIYVPYACAFWIIFGGGMASIPSMQTVEALLYSLYRLTLVDEYDFDGMVAVDSLMAHMLCGSFLFLSSILCVNLLIALLSDTFQRVYDNSQAIAVMQQASVILQVEEALPCLRRYYDNQHIHRHCAPLAQFYDHDIITDSTQHRAMNDLNSHIKELMDEFLQIQRDKAAQSSTNMDHSCNETHDETHTGEGWSAVQEEDEEEEDGVGVMKALERVYAEQQKQCQELNALKTQLGEIHNLMNTLLHNTTQQQHHTVR